LGRGIYLKFAVFSLKEEMTTHAENKHEVEIVELKTGREL
jgi:hypothetical protein